MPGIPVLILLSAIFLSVAFPESRLFAGPRLDIVIGEKAPALERLAADELAGQLKRIYEADVKIAATAPADSPHVIFVGSPDTNSSMKQFATSWPSGAKKLSDQGHLVRSVTHNNKPALVVGGGSPVATYWAAAEFGHRLGIRSMLFGDLDPVNPPEFSLEKLNVIIEPIVRSRSWFFWNSSHENDGAWELDEYRRTFEQLAKLRFTQITIVVHSSTPYLHLEHGGIAKSANRILETINVSGDTAGRKAFGGAKTFEPPAFQGATTYQDRHAAAEKHLRSLIASAHEFGLRVHVHFDITAVPNEFAPLLSKVNSGKWAESFKNKQVADLFRANLRSLIAAYPGIDGLQVFPTTVESVDEVEAMKQLLSASGVLRRADGRDVDVEWMGIDDKPIGFVLKPLLPPTKSGSVWVFELDRKPSGPLPRLRPHDWATQWQAVSKHGSFGFEIRASNACDNDLPAYWLSRISCGESLTPERACQELLTPICGNDVDQRVWKAFEFAELASQQFGDNSVTPERIRLNLHDRLFTENAASPASWSAAREGYLNAMNEMYRANTRAREGGRVFTLYLARKFEFAFEYMNCVESVRKAFIAEAMQDREIQVAELEKAIEALNNALNAMAAVARSNSDRGLIAVLNEHGYRPLKKKLAEAEAAAK